MALLVVLLPARPRAPGPLAAAPEAGVGELAWVLSPDGVHVARHGHAPVQGLPTADSVVAVLPPTDVAWHRVTCPKAPANRLRAALGSVLEDQLLDEEDATHLALAPGHAGGQPTWVAATHRGWLQRHLSALAAAGRTVDRVVPTLSPGPEPAVHFFLPNGLHAQDDNPVSPWMAMANAEQALALPLAGGHASSLLARWRTGGARWSATPPVATAAERALGQAVAIRSDVDQAMAAVRGTWQLLQFDLSPSRKGFRALSVLAMRLRSPGWRPVRWGLATLLVVQMVGLNAWAWHQQRGLEERRQAMNALLRSAHPQVRSVLDAPVQMRRETELLREAAGVPGDGDLETLLGALAQAWPDGQAPANQLRYEPGRLSMPLGTWTDAPVGQLRSRLQTSGWSLDQADGRLTVQRASSTPPAPARP